MGGIERLSNRLSSDICNKLGKSETDREVLNYGFFVIIHTFTALVLTIVVGIIIGGLLEILLITAIAAILKRTSGGSHATSPNRCIIVGIISSALLTYLVKFIVEINKDYYISLVIFIVVTISSYYVFYKKCPVGDKNKPLNNKEKRQKMKKMSLRTLNLLLLINNSLIYIYMVSNYKIILTIMLSIVFGICLQAISLTEVGNKYVKIIDYVLIHIKV